VNNELLLAYARHLDAVFHLAVKCKFDWHSHRLSSERRSATSLYELLDEVHSFNAIAPQIQKLQNLVEELKADRETLRSELERCRGGLSEEERAGI
jgi:hypothetical protein